MIPFNITFRDMESSDAVWLAIQNRVEYLESLYDGRITKCDVVVACPHHHRTHDRLFHVEIRLSLPGDDLIVNRDPQKDEAHQNVYVAIRDAFDVLERMLKNRMAKFRRRKKNLNREMARLQVEDVTREDEDFLSA